MRILIQMSSPTIGVAVSARCSARFGGTAGLTASGAAGVPGAGTQTGDIIDNSGINYMISTQLLKKIKQRREEDKNRKQDYIENRKHQAIREARRLVDVFKKIDKHLGRIVLFGSLAENSVRNENFDIDLSFEGREYYRCVSEAIKSDFKVDLVDYRACADHIREEIDTKGIVLYDPGP